LQALQQCNSNAAHKLNALCLVMFWNNNKAKQMPPTNSHTKTVMLCLSTSD